VNLVSYASPSYMVADETAEEVLAVVGSRVPKLTITDQRTKSYAAVWSSPVGPEGLSVQPSLVQSTSLFGPVRYSPKGLTVQSSPGL
jgi:hypothetical protein